jgi:hypothetical protein
MRGVLGAVIDSGRIWVYGEARTKQAGSEAAVDPSPYK